MAELKAFEEAAIRLLAANVIPDRELEELFASSEVTSLEFTGHGYFLTVRFSGLFDQRIVLDEPMVQAETGGISVGFVAFVENEELTLECCALDEASFPTNYRDLEIRVF